MGFGITSAAAHWSWAFEAGAQLHKKGGRVGGGPQAPISALQAPPQAPFSALEEVGPQHLRGRGAVDRAGPWPKHPHGDPGPWHSKQTGLWRHYCSHLKSHRWGCVPGRCPLPSSPGGPAPLPASLPGGVRPTRPRPLGRPASAMGTERKSLALRAPSSTVQALVGRKTAGPSTEPLASRSGSTPSGV